MASPTVPSAAKNFTITCHAGAMHTRPNSLGSVRRCVEGGAQIMELDVSARPDGTPVVIHSASPGKRAGELLSKALDIIAAHPTCRVNLDLKAFSFLPAVDALVAERGLEGRAFYTGVDEGMIPTVRGSSSIPYYLNGGIDVSRSSDPDYAREFALKVRALGALGVNAHYRDMTRQLVEAFSVRGLSVSVWTVDDSADQLRMLNMGVDNITTKRPDTLRRLVAAISAND